jgi:hypothetical protein
MGDTVIDVESLALPVLGLEVFHALAAPDAQDHVFFRLASSGMMMRIDWPTASAVEPKIRSAAAFHDVMMPFTSLLMIASSEPSTMAASRRAWMSGSDGNSIVEPIVTATPASGTDTRPYGR